MKAMDVMTRSVVTIDPDAPIRKAIASMIEHRISGLPVVDEDVGLVGILTEADLMHRAETGTEAPRRRWLELLLGPGSAADEYARTHGRHVCDVMSTNVVTVERDTPLQDIVRLMEEHSIKRLPVVDGKRVVGIVSRADLIAALSEHLELVARKPMSDNEIQRRILAQMKREPWCPSRGVTVIVRDGWVRLEGAIFDERQRKALHVLVTGVIGVKGIDDQLAYIEPLSGALVDEQLAKPMRISD